MSFNDSNVRIYKLPTSTVDVSVRLDFFAFIAMVINCTARMECRSLKIEVVVAAAERYLSVQDLTVYRV